MSLMNYLKLICVVNKFGSSESDSAPVNISMTIDFQKKTLWNERVQADKP